LETVVLKVEPANPEPEVIRRAAEVIRAGGLVAFPTETVYGLGAAALDSAAVARIFEAKGRPATNPVIVHVADLAKILNVAANWPETAVRLADRFWPGPLTLVVPKGDQVPSIVTAGGPTVAVRCPNHAVARALICAAGVPIAAPSANRSTELSPTRAEHVLRGLNGRIEMLLDGGPCPGGIESTVVDVTGAVPRVLRPGLITVPMLEDACGRVETGATDEGVARSPGRMVKHYSPKAEIGLCDGPEELVDSVEWAPVFGSPRVGVIQRGGDETRRAKWAHIFWRCLPDDASEYAAGLYAVLHEMDQWGANIVFIEMPPDTPQWAAVRDRLLRAAAK
jgi:L-threonylcarbamoyladenylate synthase